MLVRRSLLNQTFKASSSLIRNVTARRAISIRPMQDEDRSLVYGGLADMNWRDRIRDKSDHDSKQFGRKVELGGN